MSIRSYCYIIKGLSDTEVEDLRQIVIKESLLAKTAVLGSYGGGHKMEIVVSDEGTMKYIATLFKKRAKRQLVFVEDK